MAEKEIKEAAAEAARETRPAVMERASVHDVIRQIHDVQSIMEKVMKDGEHYGVIPGTQKPTLYKAGAEKLCVLFRYAPDYVMEEKDLGNGHMDIKATCYLNHIPTGMRAGSATGSCSTMEKKYRWREEGGACPECGQTAIIKGKKEYGGGWLCFTKKGGCGKKWMENPAGEKKRIENPDIADTWNTVRKMAQKRALVAACLIATSASDIFTQDLEDFPKDSFVPASPLPAKKQEMKETKTKKKTPIKKNIEGQLEESVKKDFGQFLRQNGFDREQAEKFLVLEGYMEPDEPLEELDWKTMARIMDEQKGKY